MLSDNAVKIFDKLYKLGDETIDGTFKRVSKEFATNEEEKKEVYNLLKQNIWRCNTPVFFNAGTKKKLYSACFVLGLEDTMDSIYDVANTSRKIFQYGAGVGIPVGNLRENNASIYDGDSENVPKGKSSGPISFMSLFDSVGETTKSGGRARRAAIMCVMPIWHPDILEFIACKEIDGRLKNMNISVVIDDKFMECLKDNIPYDLLSPYGMKKVGEINPKKVWDKISEMSWKSADPGVIFIDTVNKYNVLKKLCLIQSSNPCIVGDTIVNTNRGDIPIKNVNIKDEILTYNIKNDIVEFENIEFVGKTKENVDIIELKIEENNNIFTLKCTPDHKIYTKNRGYVEAKDLTDKDNIMCNYIS